ncbi:MAG: hypothetical protein N2316_12590 [Spirochaetes bacterium]|nr:hypothetical protein [Spirochaetota bacterium]
MKLDRVHKNCYYCESKNPFLFSNWDRKSNIIHANFTLEKKHQGWPGIPHGGVGITALVELADLLSCTGLAYPLYATFRFGGERLHIGDEVMVEVIKKENEFVGKIEKGGKQPYLTCEIYSMSELNFDQEIAKIEYIGSQNPVSSSPLVMPNYANKLIFAPHTQHLHKYRTFYFRENSDGYVYVKCSLTNSAGKDDGADVNKLGNALHPGAVITILDETLGWASFFASWQGGVTINIAAYFPEPISPGGTIYSIGYCERTSGTAYRKIANSSGGLFVKKNGIKRLVAYAHGRWLTKPEYKQKMLKYINSYSP